MTGGGWVDTDEGGGSWGSVRFERTPAVTAGERCVGADEDGDCGVPCFEEISTVITGRGWIDSDKGGVSPGPVCFVNLDGRELELEGESYASISVNSEHTSIRKQHTLRRSCGLDCSVPICMLITSRSGG